MTQEIKYDKLLTTKVLEQVPNRFLLCLAVAKRAKQLKEGMKSLVTPFEEEVTVVTALQEIGEGRVEVGLKAPESEEVEIENLEELDQMLEEELQASDEDESDDKKKDKGKPRSKSLAA